MTDQLLQLILTQAWQIAALASVVAIVNRTVAKNRPHLAHALWMLVLIKCVTPPIWGHSLGLFSQLQAMWKTEPVAQREFASDEPLLMPQSDADDEIALVPPADDPMPPGLIAMDESKVASTPIVPIVLPTTTADSSFVLEAKSWKPSWPMILLSLLAIGAVLTLSAMIVRCVLCLRHICQHRTIEFDESLNEQLQRLSKKLRLRRVPRIIVSDVLFGPAVIGLWRHVIVLPRCLIKAESGERKADDDLSALSDRLSAVSFPLSGLDPILAHELLHIRRGDLRTGTLQAIVQSLWWFHPVVWLCNRWLSREAERCCDEQVIAELGCSPAQYARSLLSVIESKHQLQPIPVFPGMKPVEITSQRMERIMSLKSNLKKQTPLWCWLAVALLAIVVLPGATQRRRATQPAQPLQPPIMLVSHEKETPSLPIDDSPVWRPYDMSQFLDIISENEGVSRDVARDRLLRRLHRTPIFDEAKHGDSMSTSDAYWEGDQLQIRQSQFFHDFVIPEIVQAFIKTGLIQVVINPQVFFGSAEEIDRMVKTLEPDTVADKESTGVTDQTTESSSSSPQAGREHVFRIVSRVKSQQMIQKACENSALLASVCQPVVLVSGDVATVPVRFESPASSQAIPSNTPARLERCFLTITPYILGKDLNRIECMFSAEGTNATDSLVEGSDKLPVRTDSERNFETQVELRADQTLFFTGSIKTVSGEQQAFLVTVDAPSQKAPAPPVVRSKPLVERRYDLGDLVSRLAKERHVPEAEARSKLLSLLEAVAPPVYGFNVPEQQVAPMVLPSPSQFSNLPADTPMPPHEKLSSFRWDGDQYCVVQQTDASHKKLQNAIERFRSHGFQQFEITATCISGPEDDIAELIRSSVGDKHELMRKNEVATCIVPKQEADAIREQVHTSSNKFMVQRPKLLVFNGQEAIVYTGQLKPWIVGFDDKDEPIVQTTTDGFSLQVTASGSDHGFLRLQSIATLEDATTVQQASIVGHSAETPRQTQIPSVHVRRVQTTVELYNEQTLIQCGLTRTHEGKAEATVVILDAKPTTFDVASAEPSTPASGSMTSNEIKNLNSASSEADQLISRVTETREQVVRRLLSTEQHSPWQIMSGIEGLRRDMLLKNGDSTVNALEWIQAGPMYQGEPWFQKTEHGGRAHPFSKPYWFEGHVNQFLSKLAACRLPLDATFGTPDGPITIQDMINHAKMVVNDKEEVSWTLLALVRYLPPDAKWVNTKGEEWSIERLVEIQVGKTVGGPTSPNGGTDGLHSLAVARNEYLKTGKPLEGVWLKADEKIKKYIDLAKSQQNPDGTLSSDFFRSSMRKDQFDRRLSSTGHLLQFLMHAVSEEQLKEDWIRRAVEATATDIQINRKEYVSCEPLFAATEALTTYLERTQGISLGLVARPHPLNVASQEASATEAVASSNDQPLQLAKVLSSPSTSQTENAATIEKLPAPYILVAYPVADQVLPVWSGAKKADFAPIVELIKATVEPESWRDGQAAIAPSNENLFVVIRQTPKAHEQIAKLLSQLNDDLDQVVVRCGLMKLTTEQQLKGIEERCTLNIMNEHKRWALLTKERSEGLAKFLTDEKCHVLLCPNITMFSGTSGAIRIGEQDDGSFKGFNLFAEPRIVVDSPIIRLKHAVDFAIKDGTGAVVQAAEMDPIAKDESLISSGQTLLLLIERNNGPLTEKTPDGGVDSKERFALMLTVERLEEEPLDK